MRDIATQYRYLICTSERSFKSQRGYILLEIEHPFVPSINKLMTVLLKFFFRPQMLFSSPLQTDPWSLAHRKTVLFDLTDLNSLTDVQRELCQQEPIQIGRNNRAQNVL
jgi:hypothetical protein